LFPPPLARDCQWGSLFDPLTAVVAVVVDVAHRRRRSFPVVPAAPSCRAHPVVDGSHCREPPRCWTPGLCCWTPGLGPPLLDPRPRLLPAFGPPPGGCRRTPPSSFAPVVGRPCPLCSDPRASPCVRAPPKPPPEGAPHRSIRCRARASCRCRRPRAPGSSPFFRRRCVVRPLPPFLHPIPGVQTPPPPSPQRRRFSCPCGGHACACPCDPPPSRFPPRRSGMVGTAAFPLAYSAPRRIRRRVSWPEI
jgi:hypothetical protein